MKETVCQCGHTHKEWVGDLGEFCDEEGYTILTECAVFECDCEQYEVTE